MMLRKDSMKRLIKSLEEREKEIDEIHEAPARLALSCLSDQDLEHFEDSSEAWSRFEDLRAGFSACSTAEEARALYLTFYPRTVNFDDPTETNLRKIEVSARMRKAP